MNRIIIDVREPEEFASGHAEGALNIPPPRLLSQSNQLTDVPKDTELILYCNSGSRSRVVINILRDQGFTNLVNGINKDHVAAKYSA